MRQLPWTHNLIILTQSKRPEEREFYLQMAIRERWSKRELERQLKAALFERSVLNPAKVCRVDKVPLSTTNHLLRLTVDKQSLSTLQDPCPAAQIPTLRHRP